MSAQPRIRCRQIGAADVPAVADLLARGFPARPRHYWVSGLDRLAERDTPEGFPRFGYMLEHDGAVVGAILLVFSTLPSGEPPLVRCNLSSWYVDPAFRSHASMLSMVPLRHKSATFLNSSPASNTWSTIEAQGFVRYTQGQFIALPALSRSEPGLRIERLRAGTALPDAATLPEAGLLADHAASGCVSLVGTSPEGLHPFVLMPFRIRQGRVPLPGMRLVYCRSTEEAVRFAAPIGRFLLRRGTPFLILDADGPMPGLHGIFLKERGRKYFKGSQRPHLGDLAYTEFTIFGP